MTILGIESTCDETGIGIVKDGRQILANVVSSSVELHQKYRGVVPEVAAREQLKVIIPAILQACGQARCKLANIDAIAVAYGPGLIGSLLVGAETAKTLALVLKKPLIPINHLIGHLYANFVREISNFKFQISNLPKFPLIALIVSGGHTDLLLMFDHGKYKWLGGTRDDACGEAFDKVARVLGLGYPGGPEVERVARNFQFPISNFQFPRPMINSNDFDFSFSGLKTAVVNLVHSERLTDGRKNEIAYEFQEAICDVLVTKTIRATKKFAAKSVVVGGGVAANSVLRSQFTVHGSQFGIPIFFPTKELSIDNGAMIAAAAFYAKKTVDPLKLVADPGLHFAGA